MPVTVMPAGEPAGIALELQLKAEVWYGVADLEDCCFALLPKRLSFGTEDTSRQVTHHEVPLECKVEPFDGPQANSLVDSIEGAAADSRPRSPSSAAGCNAADVSSNAVIPDGGGIATAEVQVGEGKVSPDHSAVGRCLLHVTAVI